MPDLAVRATRAPYPQPFAPFEMRWDAPQLSVDDMKSRRAFEWWYFDLATPDQLEMVIVFSHKNPVFSSGKASVYVEYEMPGTHSMKKHLMNFEPSAFSWREVSADQRELRIGPNRITVRGRTPEEMTYQLHLDLPWIKADLTFASQHLGFLPSRDGTYFRAADGRHTSVSFSAPHLQLQTGSTVTVRNHDPIDIAQGNGYHDHPWGTAQLFWTHRHWQWGRTKRVMFADVKPASPFEGHLRFCYYLDGERIKLTEDLELSPVTDIRKDHWYGLRFPHEVGVKIPAGNWLGRSCGSLLDTFVYNRSMVEWRGNAAPETPEASNPEAPSVRKPEGWLEYYDLRPLFRPLVFLGFKLLAFSWRRFPYFGQ